MLLPPLRAVRRPRHGPRLPRGRPDARGRPRARPTARRTARSSTAGSCPTGSTRGTQPTDRDCRHGRGAACTRGDPCTPCEAEDAALDPHAGYCKFCTADDRGKCLFTQGVGPYCKDGHGGVRLERRDLRSRTAPRQVMRLARLGGGAPARRASSGRSSGAPTPCTLFGGHRSARSAPAEVTCESAGGWVTALAQEGGPAGAGRVRNGQVDARRRDSPPPRAGPLQDRARVVRGPHGPDAAHGPGNALSAIPACVWGGFPATPAPAPRRAPTPALGDLDSGGGVLPHRREL